MKRLFTLALSLLILVSAFAKSNVVVLPENPTGTNANQVLVPIGKNGEKVSLYDLSRMKVKDLEAITGEKMKLTSKIGFMLSQKHLRSSINEDGTINNKKLNKAFAKAGGTSDFNLGGFALGLLLSIIGVLIAYLIKGDEHNARIKWAWIGFGISLVIWLLASIL
jgi:hypothetical protein